MVRILGSNITTRLETHYGVLQKVKGLGHGKKSQLSHNWSDAWVRYLDHIAQFDMSHNAPYWQGERYVNLIHLRGLDSNKQAGP